MLNLKEMYARFMTAVNEKGKLSPMEVELLMADFNVSREDTIYKYLRKMQAYGMIKITDDGGVEKP